jgi:hypothetical protein
MLLYPLPVSRSPIIIARYIKKKSLEKPVSAVMARTMVLVGCSAFKNSPIQGF